MCGIVAVVSRAPGGVSRPALDQAARRLAHRGPDARGVWTSPDCRAGLAHARLSVIDLATGDQPIESEDGRLCLVANGEFYDYERTRAELGRGGHAFRTRADSEIALHLYEERGPASVHALRGEFAYAVWDGRDGVLFAARDRFGIKPLFYAVHDGACYLASEVKALAALGVPLRWDRETLHDLHYVLTAPDRTPFAGVHQVPPGCYLLTDGASVRVVPYWDWDYPRADDIHSQSDDEHVERFRDAFDDAVRVRLRADVPVACYLSGGIDSCAVLGTASRLSPRPLRAFTLAFDHGDYDEGAIAEAQARRSGAEFCRIDVRAAMLADAFADAVYHAERPFANAHVVAKHLLSRAVRDAGIKVVLTGEGSDELLAGYPHFKRDVLLHGAHGLADDERARLLDALAASNRVSAGTLLPDDSGSARLAAVQRTLGFVPSQLEGWAQIGAAMRGLFADDFASAFAERDTYRALLGHLDVGRQMAGRDPLHQSLYVWAKSMLPNYILSCLGDRMEMAHSIEGRLPFLDHHLVEAAVRMPPWVKVRGMTEKWVLREAVRGDVTDEVYRRQKHPFLSPPATLQTDAPLYALLQDTLRGPALDGPGIYDRRRVTGLLDAVPAMDGATRQRVDAVLTFVAGVCILHERLGL